MERKTNTVVKLSADEPPRIANRSDALELLDLLIKADGVVGGVYALTALRDAIEREIIYPSGGEGSGVPVPLPFLETSGAVWLPVTK